MTDRFVIRLVVAFLGLIAVLGLIGGFVLAYEERAVPDFLIGTTSACIGAIAGILSRTSSEGGGEGGEVSLGLLFLVVAIICGVAVLFSWGDQRVVGGLGIIFGSLSPGIDRRLS